MNPNVILAAILICGCVGAYVLIWARLDHVREIQRRRDQRQHEDEALDLANSGAALTPEERAKWDELMREYATPREES